MLDLAPLLDVLARFPVEAVPDGEVFGPHHLYAVLLAVLSCWVVGDDYRDREPVLVLVAAVGAALAFALVWPWYHALGAVLTLAGLLAVLSRPVLRWGIYPRRWRAVASGGALVGLDDWWSHALHPVTPGEVAWRLLGPWGVVAVAAAVAAVAWLYDRRATGVST